MSAARSELDRLIDENVSHYGSASLVDKIKESEQAIKDLNQVIQIVNAQHNYNMGYLKFMNRHTSKNIITPQTSP